MFDAFCPDVLYYPTIWLITNYIEIRSFCICRKNVTGCHSSYVRELLLPDMALGHNNLICFLWMLHAVALKIPHHLIRKKSLTTNLVWAFICWILLDHCHLFKSFKCIRNQTKWTHWSLFNRCKKTAKLLLLVLPLIFESLSWYQKHLYNNNK